MAGRGTSAKTAEQKAAPETAEQETAEKAAPETAEQETAEKAAPETAEPTKPTKPAKGEVTVKVAAAISGTRNGEPWPAVGEPITLPEAEAASYIQFGYVTPIGD